MERVSVVVECVNQSGEGERVVVLMDFCRVFGLTPEEVRRAIELLAVEKCR